ncbi:YkvA family protein [Methyloceanibacter sp.]|uniref:YkvA family protein n=1 Tax=Methyloceanibacter sp. TaxID=1965321 RepID=UPI002C563E46|nr:YkvA family protein [Methyloceanibacter sp.]HML91639.1 YkvA family protein [Methyloceanibacter sp.]
MGREMSMDTLSEREQKVRRDFWTKLKRVAGNVPFVEDLVAAYYCAMDPATPMRVRGMLLAALAYFIMPIDLVPDIVAGLGFADDMALLTAVVGLVSSSITPVHRAAAARTLDKELPARS